MKKGIVYIVDAVCLLFAMALGIFGPVGLCAAIWGGSILDTALGDPPIRTHPAFIVFIILIAPSMLLSAIGAIIAIIIPLHIKTGIPLGDRDRFLARTLKQLADKTEYLEKKTEPNQSPEPTIFAVTSRAPSSTSRASEDRGSS